MESANFFLTLKVIHIIAIISWLCGLLYLPRIFVYHCQVKANSDSDKIFQIMENKLLRYIMNPAMIVVFISGIFLILSSGFSCGWLHFKILLVLFMAIFHAFLSIWRKNFAKNKNNLSEKFYRIINEVPTILMIIIIYLVIFKPF